MSKASEYAKAVASQPRIKLGMTGSAIVTPEGDLMLWRAEESVLVQAEDVPALVAWLKETFDA